jgi:hypothetical protein
MKHYLLNQTYQEAERLVQQCDQALTIVEQNQLVDDMDTFMQRELGIGVEDLAEYITIVAAYLEQRFPA